MIDINYELYKVFYHVASTLNFSEASKRLFISQSAVSQSIKTLERKLDQTLFIRSTKKVQLTPEGEILMRHIEPAMNLIQKGETQLLDAASTGGQIRMAYLVFAGAQDLGQAVTLLWTFKLPWHWAYHGTLFHDGVAQFAFGFYSVMLTSTVLGLITMVLFKPRSWCVYCPMGTMTQLICKAKNKKSMT